MREFLDRLSVFTPLLASLGFHATRQWIHREMAGSFYRNGERYIMISFSMHYQDGSEHISIELGEGSDEFPEADWNAIALRQLSPDAGQWTGEPYAIVSHGSIEAALQKIMMDLQALASDFLQGSLDRFHVVRRESVRQREPYTISGPRSFTFWRRTTVDPVSAALKERFSK